MERERKEKKESLNLIGKKKRLYCIDKYNSENY